MSSAKPALTTDISNYADTGYGDPSQTMKALTWQAKNHVKLGKYTPTQLINSFHLEVCWLLFVSEVETARPTIVDDEDVILKVTGSTICGSDLHLLHCMCLITKASHSTDLSCSGHTWNAQRRHLGAWILWNSWENRSQGQEAQNWGASCGFFPDCLWQLLLLWKEIVVIVWKNQWQYHRKCAVWAPHCRYVTYGITKSWSHD